MGEREPTRRDGRFFAVVVGVFALGALCLAGGVWGVVTTTDTGVWIYRAWPGAGIVCGPILMGFSIMELVHRLRRGPQKEGRHSRP